MCHAVLELDATNLVFLIFSLKLALSLSSFTLIKGSLVPLGSLIPLPHPEEEGTYVYLKLIHIVIQQKLIHCKAIILQLKKKYLKRRQIPHCRKLQYTYVIQMK